MCTSTRAAYPGGLRAGHRRGGAGALAGPPNRQRGTGGSTTNYDHATTSIVADDTGRAVTGTNIPANSFVGAVSDHRVRSSRPTNTGSATQGSFQLVDQAGNPVDPTGPGHERSPSSAEGIRPASSPPAKPPDPLFDATDPTPGGGDTGSVLISPFIKPGTESQHRTTTTTAGCAPWRTCSTSTPATSHDPHRRGAGSVSGGLDGLGHIGYAAQTGLRPFGRDVFTNPTGHEPSPGVGTTRILEAGMPAGGVILLLGGFLGIRWRQKRRRAVTI